MLKINEFGRSMAEMLGVLAIIGILSGGGLAGFGKGMYKYKLSKTVEVVTDAIQNFVIFTQRNFSDYPSDESHMAQNAKNSGLLPNCKLITSQADPSHDACSAPLGELYPKFILTGEQFTYSLHVTFLKGYPQVCGEFLSNQWTSVIPEKWRRKGKIIVSSNKEDRNLDLTSDGPTLNAISRTCRSVCKNAQYCSVIFEFMGYAY